MPDATSEPVSDFRSPTEAAPIAPEPDRVALAMERWRRRSRMIRFFRRALPVAIGVIFASLVGWIGLRSVLANLPNLNPAGATIRMTNPHFYGQDDRGRSFTIGGSQAVRRRVRGKDIVQLFDPMLKLQTGPERTMEVSGKLGVYDEPTKLLRISGGVHMVDTGSHVDFRTGEALVETRTGNVTGNSPVNGRSPLGAVSASSYAIFDRGARIEFNGGVRSRIEQRTR